VPANTDLCYLSLRLKGQSLSGYSLPSPSTAMQTVANYNYNYQQQQLVQAMGRRRQRTAQPQQHRHHSVVNTNDKRFWCPDCDLKTGAQFRLDKHREKKGPLVAKFSCPGCSFTWTSAHAYCSHYQVLTATMHCKLHRLQCIEIDWKVGCGL
jgi:DNA-directed RNA polymerase subunit M/transcription elongation factor TFIIS